MAVGTEQSGLKVVPVVKTVGIFSKPNSPPATELVPELLRWLAQHGIQTRLDNETARYAVLLQPPQQVRDQFSCGRRIRFRKYADSLHRRINGAHKAGTPCCLPRR